MGWRKDVFEANPPYVDKDRVDYDYKREDHSCGGGATNDKPYNKAKWLANLKDLATLANTYDNIIGIDIFNEPWVILGISGLVWLKKPIKPLTALTKMC